MAVDPCDFVVGIETEADGFVNNEADNPARSEAVEKHRARPLPAPEAAPTDVGLPPLPRSASSQPTIAADAAAIVFVAIRPTFARLSSHSAPALKPNQRTTDGRRQEARGVRCVTACGCERRHGVCRDRGTSRVVDHRDGAVSSVKELTQVLDPPSTPRPMWRRGNGRGSPTDPRQASTSRSVLCWRSRQR